MFARRVGLCGVNAAARSNARFTWSRKPAPMDMAGLLGRRGHPTWARQDACGAAARRGAGPLRSAVVGALASDEIHRVLDQIVEDRQSIAHAALAAGQV